MNHEQLLRELHTGLALVKQQQTQINTRIGLIEKTLQDEEDRARDKRSEWWTWLLQIIGQVILVTALVAVGQSLGVEVSG